MKTLVLALGLGVLAAGCPAAKPTALPKFALPKLEVPPSNSSADKVLAHSAEWRLYHDRYAPDPKIVARIKPLLASRADYHVQVIYGDWCGDSKQNTSRFVKLWSALGPVAARITYWNVDRKKREPTGFTGRYFIRKVPTFVVERAGLEVGRIIEHPISSLEADLLEILERK